MAAATSSAGVGKLPQDDSGGAGIEDPPRGGVFQWRDRGGALLGQGRCGRRDPLGEAVAAGEGERMGQATGAWIGFGDFMFALGPTSL